MPTTGKSRRRRHRRTSERRRFLTGVVLFVLALAVAIYLVSTRELPSPEPVPLSAGLTSQNAQPAAEPARSSDREVYPYSVIDGGAWSVAELKHAISHDPVVAAHYSGFALEKTRVERLPAARLAHVSYRIGDAVYWTRKPIALRAGEPVLTDGVHIARTRCGNQLADTPGETSPLEPSQETMNVPMKPGPASVSSLTLLHPPISLPAPVLPGSFAPAGEMNTPLGGAGAAVAGIGSLSPAAGGLGAREVAPREPEISSNAAPEAGPVVANGPGLPPVVVGLPPLGSVPPATLPLSGTVPVVGLPPLESVPPVTLPLSGTVPPDGVPPPGGPNPGDGPHVETPGSPVTTPIGEPHDPVSVPEPGTTLLLAGGAAYALRRIRAARR